MSETTQNTVKEAIMPDQIFAGYRIGIVTDNDNVAAVLSKAFQNRGGEVLSFSDGYKAIESARSSHLHVLIVTEGIAQFDAAYCAKSVREEKLAQVEVLWHIGKAAVPLMDGFIPRPFRPIELLKPIYEKLMVAKSQKVREPAAASAPAKAPAAGTPAGAKPPAAGTPASGKGPAASAPAVEGSSAQAKAPVKPAAPAEGAASPARPAAATATARHGLKKILIVDDEEDLRNVTISILNDEGYEVLSACNGLAALDLIKQHQDIAVMLLDLKMPGMNGMQLLTAVRNLGLGMDDCHIIIVSAFQRPELVETAKKLGVTLWVSKPFNPDLLLEFIHKTPVAK